MKKLILRPSIAAAVLLLAGFAASAQPMPGSSPGVNSELTKFFGSHTAFTAMSNTRVLDKNQKETASVVTDFALLDGKMRAEVDMTQMKSADMPPNGADMMKQMGMDRVVSIIRPDKKVMYIVCPGLKSYANMPLPKESAEASGKESKSEKTLLGKETIDGHACEKNKVVLTDDKGGKQEAILWNASDLKDFPVQIQTEDQGKTVIIRYSQIQFAKPDAKQFDPPAGFTEYEDMQKMMMSAMQKMMPGGMK